MCIYDINHTYKLQMKNRNESDLRSCEAIEAVAKKAHHVILDLHVMGTYIN